MSHIIQCRLCKKRFDTEEESYILVGQLSYYHKRCYDEWLKSRNNIKTLDRDAEFWYESLIDYLYRDIKMSINFAKLNNQWHNFTKPDKQMTPKGIYFAIRYYYDVLKGSTDKAQGGIGIVGSIYKDAAQYWVNLETKKEGTIAAIIEQINQRANRQQKVIVQKDNLDNNKSKWSLDDI